VSQDLYRALECPPNATLQEIRTSYKRLVRKYHPDLNPNDPEAERRFKQITQAFGILSDAEQRAQYDRHGAASLHPEFAARRLVRGADLRLPLHLSFVESVNGAVRTVNVPIGEVEPRRVEVRVPPGIRSDQVLWVEGGGEPGHPPGDLLLDVSVAPHPVFRRHGRTVILDLPVSLGELVLGADITLPTPTGKIPFRIPPDTAPDAELWVRGHGVAATAKNPAGDLKVLLRLKLPAGLSARSDAPEVMHRFEALYDGPVRDGWFQSVGAGSSPPSTSPASASDPFREDSTFSGLD
jgi:DnaJ-class molecular chaperone